MRHFKPSLSPSIALVLVLPLLLWLGFWQLDRAESKEARHALLMQRQDMPELQLGPGEAGSLSQLEAGAPLLWRRARVHGVLDEGAQILLDNQVMHARAGYFVFTPLTLPGESMQLLVNRGWVPAGHDRNKLPDLIETQGAVTLHAVIKERPAVGVGLSASPPEQMSPGVYRVNEIDIAALSVLLERDLFHYVLRLRPDSGYGYDRAWPLPVADRKKHLGYAFQWFALAFVLVAAYILLNFKKN